MTCLGSGPVTQGETWGCASETQRSKKTKIMTIFILWATIKLIYNPFDFCRWYSRAGLDVLPWLDAGCARGEIMSSWNLKTDTMQQNHKTHLKNWSPKRSNNTPLLIYPPPPKSSLRISICHMYLENLMFFPFWYGYISEVALFSVTIHLFFPGHVLFIWTYKHASGWDFFIVQNVWDLAVFFIPLPLNFWPLPPAPATSCVSLTCDFPKWVNGLKYCMNYIWLKCLYWNILYSTYDKTFKDFYINRSLLVE